MSAEHKIRVWYHANCKDGFTSAWAAWKKFGDGAEYVPCSYGKPPPEHGAGDTIYILDFSFSRKELLELHMKNDVVVLDHHKTAEENLAGLPFCVFDMERSGAMMTWEYFFPKTRAPLMVQHVQDRDLWKFDLHGTKEVAMCMDSMDKTFENWDALNKELSTVKRGAVYARGKAILDFQRQQVLDTVKGSWVTKILGKKAAVVNSTRFFSEVCHEMLAAHPDAELAATFGFSKSGEVLWSLRSRTGDGVDVSKIANHFKGGGHKHAAGMKSKTIWEVILGWG